MVSTDFVEHINQGIPDKEYIVGNWLARGEMLMLFADRGAGKTYLSLLLGHCFASGSQFMGKSVKPMTVLYLDGEMGKDALSRRVQKIDNSEYQDNALMKGRFFVHSFEDCPNSVMWNLSNQVHQRFYDQKIEETGAEVVIVDNINTCHSLMSNRDSDMEAWLRIQAWAVKKRQQGVTIIFVHHAGKSGLQLGTSQRENIMDYILQIRRSRIETKVSFTGIEVKLDKVRDVAPDAFPDLFVEFSIDPETNSFIYEHESLKECKAREANRLLSDGMKDLRVCEKLQLPRWQLDEIKKLRNADITIEEKLEDSDDDRFW